MGRMAKVHTDFSAVPDRLGIKIDGFTNRVAIKRSVSFATVGFSYSIMKLKKKRGSLTGRLNVTGKCRISGIANRTITRRRVIDYSAFGVQTANAWTRIAAFVIHARFTTVAIGIRHAFRSTSGVRVAEIFR